MKSVEYVAVFYLRFYASQVAGSRAVLVYENAIRVRWIWETWYECVKVNTHILHELKVDFAAEHAPGAKIQVACLDVVGKVAHIHIATSSLQQWDLPQHFPHPIHSANAYYDCSNCSKSTSQSRKWVLTQRMDSKRNFRKVHSLSRRDYQELAVSRAR